MDEDDDGLTVNEYCMAVAVRYWRSDSGNLELDELIKRCKPAGVGATRWKRQCWDYFVDSYQYRRTIFHEPESFAELHAYRDTIRFLYVTVLEQEELKSRFDSE